jgi:hypothetical protein
MKVEITRNVMINGEPVKAGSFVEVDRGVANLLIGSDKARIAVEPEPEPVKRTRTKSKQTEEQSD